MTDISFRNRQSKTQRVIPANGDTIIMLPNIDGDMLVILDPVAPIAGITLNWIPSPLDGQQVTVLSTKTITTISHTTGSLNKAAATLTTGNAFCYRYDATNGVWMCLYNGCATEALQAAQALTPQTWLNGVQKSNVKQIFASANVSSGVVTFALVDSVSGAAIFANPYLESAELIVFDVANSYVFGGYTLAGDKKSVSFTIRKLSATSSNGLINLVGGLVAFLTGLAFVAPANGLTVYLKMKGD